MSSERERSIFLEAIEEEDLSKRQSYVDRACLGAPTIRRAVEALLAAHDRPENPLDDLLVDRHTPSHSRRSRPHSPVALDEPTRLGDQIGDYRLMEQIGEGGFGQVFVALQERPLERKVALKIVKPGMGSKEVIARFEAERQAVAMMDHPHIARIFAAGVTSDARPYFVMELVRGVPITEFCDHHRYDVPERLKLFIDVCSAVQHAHQKGVIHRDLKPSNVMVTLQDGKPIVKVIDFGVAKAIGQNLTDKTIYTRFFSMIGTPLYMSPEQAEMSSLDVDTRSDIYSLGIMLYEMLVGTTPIAQERLDSAGFDELRRIIREEQPPLPSARLTTLEHRMTTVAMSRRTDPNRLNTTIRGDLDWIVMKALEKDRSRRYESAADMANDIRRYLEAKPIQARPPSTSYLVAKFARRNRATLITTALLATALLAGTCMSLWQMLRALDERDKKDVALQAALVARREATEARQEIERFADDLKTANLLIASGQAQADSGRWQAAQEDYTLAVETQPSYFLPWVLRGQLYTRMHLWDEAASDYELALNLNAPIDEPPWWCVPTLFLLAEKEAAHRTLFERCDQLLSSEDSHPRWMTLRGVVTSTRLSQARAADLLELARDWEKSSSRPPPRRDNEFRLAWRDDGPPPRREEVPPPRGSRRRAGGGENGPRPPGAFGYRRDAEFVPPNLSQFILALTLIRAQRYQPAIQILEELAKDRNWPSAELVQGPLAIAYLRLGNEAEATLALGRSARAIEDWAERLREQRGLASREPWFDFAEAIVLHREATITVTGQAALEGPELRALRDSSLELINSP